MTELIKVKNHDNLRRDPGSKAVLNIDTRGYLRHLQEKKHSKKIQELSNFQTEVREDINTLKQQMSQLQELILKSLEK